MTTLERLQAIIRAQLYDDERLLTDDTRLAADLGFDSLDLVEITLDAEDAFLIQLDDEAAAECETVGQLVALIDAALAKRVAA